MNPKHARNIANFETLIVILDELGTHYNPVQTLLLRAVLRAKLEEAKAVFDEADTSQAACEQILYDPETGILRLVKLIKAQLAKKPGKTSPAYRQIDALEFRKY